MAHGPDHEKSSKIKWAERTGKESFKVLRKVATASRSGAVVEKALEFEFECENMSRFELLTNWPVWYTVTVLYVNVRALARRSPVLEHKRGVNTRTRIPFFRMRMPCGWAVHCSRITVVYAAQTWNWEELSAAAFTCLWHDKTRLDSNERTNHKIKSNGTSIVHAIQYNRIWMAIIGTRFRLCLYLGAAGQMWLMQSSHRANTWHRPPPPTRLPRRAATCAWTSSDPMYYNYTILATAVCKFMLYLLDSIMCVQCSFSYIALLAFENACQSSLNILKNWHRL